jgi:GGDEF domain-containing protein
VGLLERLSVPRRMEATALLVYAVVFVLLVAYGKPGLGISQGFYLAIVLVALAGGPVSGVAAGVLATLLCALAALSHGGRFDEALEPLGIRVAAFTLAGFAVGYFSRRGRQMLAESFHVLDELLRLARRETATGVLTPDGISARIAERAGGSWPFAVLVGDVGASSDAVLRDSMRSLAGVLDDGDELARVGRTRVAVVAPAHTAVEARQVVGQLEAALPGSTFGWALHPQDGDEALALVGAASERLQARRTDGDGVVVRLESTG